MVIAPTMDRATMDTKITDAATTAVMAITVVTVAAITVAITAASDPITEIAAAPAESASVVAASRCFLDFSD